MPPIPAEQAKARFTQDLVAVYKDVVKPTAFLQSFFPIVERATRFLNYEVQRHGEFVAIDRLRGDGPNLNKFSLRDNKILNPPFYSESFNATEMDGYDTLFGTNDVTKSQVADFMADVVEKLMSLQWKIDRAKEIQCAGLFKDGKVVLVAGDTIDFKRKDDSMVDIGSGNYWDTHPTTADPFLDIENGCIFLRTIGKAVGATFNLIPGRNVYNALLNTDKFKERAKWVNTKLDELRPAVRNSVGAFYKGRLDCGSFSVDVWTYPEFYDVKSGGNITATPYIDDDQFILLPENPNFKMGHALVPQLPPEGLTKNDSARTVKKGAYVINDFVDVRKKTWEFEISACPVAMAIAIDQIYTATVTAGS